ncbi:MAG: MXAN_5187 C-terminal domain-containing protein [Pseudomonadota bacterium]
MENAELEVALEELESRLERLRALYEQYFMGIERIEPAIPRKDIDRRIYVLRREKIRNTAKRFKLQTIISRYNTFQQYWQRICREIENGTYKRHVIRAERIAPGQFLTIAARKRLGRAALEAMEPEAASPEAATPSVPPPPSAPRSARPAAPSPRLAPPPKPVPPPKPGTRPAPPANVPVDVPAAARPVFESLDLDMDFLGDWDPSTAPAKSSAGKRVAEMPARPFGKPLSQPMGTPLTPGAAAPAPPPRTPPAKPAPPLSATAPRVPSAPPPRPVAAPPRPAPATISKPLAAQPAPPPAAARPLAPIIPGTTPAKPSPPRPPTPAAPSASVSDERVRELHARLVEAKRQTQDGGAVSMEGLAKSIKATEAKLQEQHKNRKIDFDVVIKDGKAVLKPIVR